MKILAWDLESSYNVTAIWRTGQQYVGEYQILKPSEVICFGARWVDQKGWTYKSIHHHSKEEMLETAWGLLDEADALLSWNGKKFDTRKMNTDFKLAGMGEPSPSKEIDLMVAAKRKFDLPSYKLDYVSKILLGRKKVEHEGLALWQKCADGDESAWRKMRQYNKGDVDLLIDLYDELLPWIPNHPNVLLYEDEVDGDSHKCPGCASTKLQSRGFRTTQIGKFRQYQCQDCGKWSSDGKRVATTPLRAVV